VTEPRSAVATILFTDLVRSTHLLERLGDKRAQAVFQAHHQLLRQAIAAHGGNELQWLGDGLMAAFGSAEDGVACAIAMQEAIENRDAEGELRIRVGLHTGEVLRQDTGSGYFGTTVVKARRLCDQAEAGTILCSSGVSEPFAGDSRFRFRELGGMTLRGVAGDVHVLEILYERRVQRDDEDESAPEDFAPLPLPGLLTQRESFPFSGRSAEMDRLKALWCEAESGVRRCVLLSGEPGIGKTRLAAEVARAVHATGANVLFGRCDEDMGVPFQPFVEAFEHYLAQLPDGHVRGRLGRYAGELARLVPDIALRLPGLPPALQSDPATERLRLFDAVTAWLMAAASGRPLLLVLDDLHWAPTPTLLLLRHVVRGIVPARLMIIGTHRDTEVDREHPLAKLLADLRPVSGVERLPLHGLDEAGVLEFVEQASGDTLGPDGRELARGVHAETAGNPFFVGQVLRHLAESGAIARREGRWQRSVDVAGLGIPEAVRDVVLRRVARLSRAASECLTLAAVVGRDFELATLVGASPLDELPILAALDEAIAARLVEETGVDSYRFTHALVRSALYEAVSASRQARMHHAVAEVIESLRPDDAAALAHQFGRAGPAHRAKAVAYATRAGDHAATRLAHDQAAEWYERAIRLLNGTADADPGQRCELGIRLGEVQKSAGSPAYRETLLAAGRLAIDLGDTARLVRAARANSRGWVSGSGRVDEERVTVLRAALAALEASDGAARASLLASLGAELQYAGDAAVRLALSDEALEMARRVGDDETLAHVLNLRGHTIWAPHTHAERLANSAEHVAVAARVPDPLARWYASATRLQFCLEAGDLAEVDRHLDVLRTLTPELGRQTHLRWAASIDFAWRALLAARLGDAEKLASEAYELGVANGQQDALTYYAGQLFAIRFEQGRVDEMIVLLEGAVADNPLLPAFQSALALAYCEADRKPEALPLLEKAAAGRFAEQPLDLSWTTGMAFYAEVSHRLGQREPARQLYERLAPFARLVVFNGLFVFGAVERSLGLLAHALGDLDRAQTHLQAAIELHSQLEAPALLARTQLDLAATRLERGAPSGDEEARSLIEAARSSARHLGLTALERRALRLSPE